MPTQAGGQPPIGQAATDEVTQGQPQADQQQGAGHATGRDAGHLLQQGRDIGEEGEHGGGEEHRHRQRQPEAEAAQGEQFLAQVGAGLVAVGRQHAPQTDQGHHADGRHCPEGRAPASGLAQGGTQGHAQHIG
ncbi:hypothetical protein Q3H58_003981 [Pseudomonas psychrotolerans]|nr:hypothetical protein [Pseudomonas psychrotolerans]